jgi:hypothetical protein
VRDTNVAADTERRLLPKASESTSGLDGSFTPSQFFKEAGITIGVCLGLALLAQVLVTMVGAH